MVQVHNRLTSHGKGIFTHRSLEAWMCNTLSCENVVTTSRLSFRLEIFGSLHKIVFRLLIIILVYINLLWQLL
jgi:hypothetical protein